MILEPTGERMVEEHYTGSLQDHVIHILHLATYRFAEAMTRGKRVLDFGCGSGYGSAMIAETADSVVAVDVAADAVAYARDRFIRENLSFDQIDPSSPLPFADASFDMVLSFQVFEHVTDTEHYLSEIRRILVPGGKLLLVTPDRDTRLLPLQRPWNRWHVKEYSKRGLQRELSRHFGTVSVMGMTGRDEMIELEVRRCARVKWMTLPVTLPVMPDNWRVAALNMIHRLRGRTSGEPCACPFTIGDVTISADATPSVNLVAIAA
ncbi:class I SAM-dependent methyltransferase [Novosphingobium album (ex Hu et al. 2023)]|uniref:Class I SAM-dependent methyltransferase n=1 Tax=Novosphingobium album (ex Hu et al. 2023) TaxID=2930093 RepID=A0ABT0AZQ8_9SPHN|nr:class I SAM-dependent methyltransferase [Novosphingobium album (ex Hu et al. 2023)]MCJ2178128.1 class I SAM-dependent methyltransferase [Novosphingobium album (ex Hu et al. 2023)]